MMNVVGITHSYISQSSNVPLLNKGAVRAPSPSDFTVIQDISLSRADKDDDSKRLENLLKKKFKSVKQMAQYMLLLMKKYLDIKAQGQTGNLNFEQEQEIQALLNELEDMGKGDRPPVDTESFNMIV